MKKLIFLTVMSVMLASCDKTNKANTQLNRSVDSLSHEVSQKDSIINEAFLDIDQIASSLNQITLHENLVNKQAAGDIDKTKKEQIADNILAISDLLDKNRAAIARLSAAERKLSAANVDATGLRKLVASLQTQIEEKDGQIAQLTVRLESMNIEIQELTSSVTNLQGTVSEQTEKITEQKTAMNTVYYIVGVEKDLMDKNIIDKKGFIGRTGVVGSNLETLTKADARNLDRISVGAKKIRIVSSHPDGSYMLVQNDNKVVEEIVITDKDKFWSSSKVLIISHK